MALYTVQLLSVQLRSPFFRDVALLKQVNDAHCSDTAGGSSSRSECSVNNEARHLDLEDETIIPQNIRQ